IAKVLPEQANPQVKWKSKNPKIVTAKNGVLIAKKPGTAKVICTFANQKTLICTVTVTAE
ncbi:MAG: hypothetical protein RSD95_17295, partial [Clostridia bacterium]